jgi:two-component system, sensor histidine kinase
VRNKLIAVMLGTALVALLVTAIAMTLYEVRNYERMLVGDLRAQADIIGRASAAALSFQDPKAARETLSLLQIRPQVVGAGIYDAQGRLFASYGEPRDPAAGGAPAAGEHYRIEGGRITLTRPIIEKRERIGSVELRARYELYERLAGYLVILALSLFGGLGAALLLSVWLQRAVTAPILRVAGAARDVVERRDYSPRVAKTTEDEIGDLVAAFNAMLTEIGRRTAEIEASHRALEREMGERRLAEDALRAADRRKDEFLATLAHELRNPLAPIQNALHLMRLSERGEDRERSLAIMQRQLGQMVRLIDDLLDVSRITTGKISLRREPLDLREAIQSALETCRPLLVASEHRVATVIPEERLPVLGDRVRLAQVFSNLIHNAAKFTPRGGSIAVRAVRQDASIAVSVQDTGIGIPPDMLAAVFEMFTQADRSLERAHSGLGVGLALAKRLVELHHGTIEAFSEGDNRGTRVVAMLPLAEESALAEQADAGEERTPAGLRILLADDNVDFALTTAELMRTLGNEVRVAHDGAEALDVAAEFRPQVAFIDIGMPKLNGYEVARRMRERPAPGCMLVAVTGWGQDSDRQRSRQAGFDHHLVKPVDLAQVTQILERFRRHAQRA